MYNRTFIDTCAEEALMFPGNSLRLATFYNFGSDDPEMIIFTKSLAHRYISLSLGLGSIQTQPCNVLERLVGGFVFFFI